MRLTQLVIAGFRNLETVRIEPGNRFNLFYGLNGQGKTNLLEAITSWEVHALFVMPACRI